MPTGAECPFGTQFPPPATSLDTGKPLHGFCESTNTGYQHADCPFAVVDRLVVPADMAEGDWVLSFRWGAPNPRPQPAYEYLLCARICRRPCSFAQPARGLGKEVLSVRG